MNKKRVFAFIAVICTAVAAQAYVRVAGPESKTVAFFAAYSDNNSRTDHQRALVPSDTKFGFINKQGKLVIPAIYNRAHEFSEGLAAIEENNNWGYIDPTGKKVIEPQYITARDFSQGLAAVRKDMYGGYLDKKGVFAIEPKYGRLDTFEENGTAIVSYGKLSEVIDRKGKTLIGPKYKTIGLVSKDLYWIETNNKFGIANISGQIVVEPQYDSIGVMNEGLIPFKHSERWGYLNSDGKIVIEAKYLFAGTFANGVAFVKQADGKNTLISKDEKIVFSFPKKADGITLLQNSSTAGKLPVYEGGLIPMMDKGRWGYASTKTGEFVIAPQFASAAPFKNGLALVGITKRTPEAQMAADVETGTDSEEVGSEKAESESGEQ